MAMLEVTSLGISFGGLRAVDELSMKIEKGGLVGLIGPNGAGKTTAFNMLTGVYRPTDGGIRLDGQNLIGKKPHEICKLGVARTFQNIRLFSQHERAGQRKDRPAQPDHLLVRRRACSTSARYRKKEKQMDRKGDGAAASVFDLDGVARLQACSEPALRQAAQARDRARARYRPEAAAARRAGRGHEPERDRRS